MRDLSSSARGCGWLKEGPAARMEESKKAFWLQAPGGAGYPRGHAANGASVSKKKGAAPPRKQQPT